jgi:hypothetical protein
MCITPFFNFSIDIFYFLKSEIILKTTVSLRVKRVSPSLSGIMYLKFWLHKHRKGEGGWGLRDGGLLALHGFERIKTPL